jgi:hypothetical protein
MGVRTLQAQWCSMLSSWDNALSRQEWIWADGKRFPCFSLIVSGRYLSRVEMGKLNCELVLEPEADWKDRVDVSQHQ